MPWDIILCLCTTNDNYMMYGSWVMEHNRHNFFVILDYFLPFYSPNHLPNQNFEKNKKTTWRYHHFTRVYHKWQSYDVWFLRYEEQQTEFFVILGYFAHLYQNYDHILYFSWDMTNGRCKINFHFGLFSALLPH